MTRTPVAALSLVLLVFPLTARADPSAEAQQLLKEAFRACAEAQGGKIDLPLFQRYMESRAKAVKADPAIRAWTGKLDGQTVNTRFEACEALFQKALADAQNADAKPAASADDEREVIAWGENGAKDTATFLGQYRDLIKKAGGSSQPNPAMVDSHLRELAALRESMTKKVPAWAKLKTTKELAGRPAGTELGTLLSGLEAELKQAQSEGAKTVSANDAKSNAESKKIQKQMAEAYKRWTSKVKGDRLKVLKRWPATPGDDSLMNAETWRFTLTHGAGNCDFVYHFKGNTLSERKVEGAGCEDAKEP
jgi:hypothetical protein